MSPDVFRPEVGTATSRLCFSGSLSHIVWSTFQLSFDDTPLLSLWETLHDPTEDGCEGDHAFLGTNQYLSRRRGEGMGGLERSKDGLGEFSLTMIRNFP